MLLALTRKMTSAAHVLGALLVLSAIALTPVAIVLLAPGHHGGIWVAGYVTGMVTAPMVAIATLRAITALHDEIGVNVATLFVAFGVAVTLISLAAALWSFLA